MVVAPGAAGGSRFNPINSPPAASARALCLPTEASSGVTSFALIQMSDVDFFSSTSMRAVPSNVSFAGSMIMSITCFFGTTSSGSRNSGVCANAVAHSRKKAGRIARDYRISSTTVASNLDDPLTDVLPMEQSDECLRCVLESFDDVLAIFEFPLAYPGGHFFERLGEARGVIGNQESLDLGSIDDHRA